MKIFIFRSDEEEKVFMRRLEQGKPLKSVFYYEDDTVKVAVDLAD